MKRFMVGIVCAVTVLAGGAPESVTDAGRRICLPNPGVVGRGADEVVALTEKVPGEGGVLPDAVEVMIGKGCFVAVVAKYFTDDISFKDFAKLLTARHGKPLIEDTIDTAHWRFESPAGRRVLVFLHKQGNRVTVAYREDDEAEDAALKEAVRNVLEKQGQAASNPAP